MNYPKNRTIRHKFPERLHFIIAKRRCQLFYITTFKINSVTRHKKGHRAVIRAMPENYIIKFKTLRYLKADPSSFYFPFGIEYILIRFMSVVNNPNPGSDRHRKEKFSFDVSGLLYAPKPLFFIQSLKVRTAIGFENLRKPKFYQALAGLSYCIGGLLYRIRFRYFKNKVHNHSCVKYLLSFFR